MTRPALIRSRPLRGGGVRGADRSPERAVAWSRRGVRRRQGDGVLASGGLRGEENCERKLQMKTAAKQAPYYSLRGLESSDSTSLARAQARAPGKGRRPKGGTQPFEFICFHYTTVKIVPKANLCAPAPQSYGILRISGDLFPVTRKRRPAARRRRCRGGRRAGGRGRGRRARRATRIRWSRPRSGPRRRVRIRCRGRCRR